MSVKGYLNMKNAGIIVMTITALFFVVSGVCAQEIVLFSFEEGPQGWSIPDWALAKDDNAGEEVSISEHYASVGERSFELVVDFPGVSDWRGAYVECPIGVTDWSPYSWLSVDIYLPESAPRNLRARIILTVGEDWKWTESNKAIRLTPGEWTVIRVNMKPESLDWRRFIDDEFRGDVRKLGIRIESTGADYKGSIYIDNIKLTND
ncbi:MAG: hypothetical protein ABIJ27_01700 [Candidatus Omnitrophota bacterium]